jgi:hypothetical protein
MKILALDLGTKTGWALGDKEQFTSGTWTLAKPKEITEFRQQNKDRSGDPRFFRLLDLLTRCRNAVAPSVVAFEDVEFSTFTGQTQLWSSLRCAVWAVFGRSAATIVPIPVATIKKLASGHGGATKDMMARAILRHFPRMFRTGKTGIETSAGRSVDDNEVDAVHILRIIANHDRFRN